MFRNLWVGALASELAAVLSRQGALELDRKSVAELEVQGDRESPTYRRAAVRLAEH